MIRLDKKQVKMLHELVLKDTGGSGGLLNEGLLDSALQAPFQTFDGQHLYKSLAQKAARLCYSLISNHPFIDGNKRIGILVMMVFLELNGTIIECTDDELVKAGLDIAAGKMDDKQLLHWILDHS